MSKYKSFSHCKFRMSYHIIFSVKFRRKLLEEIRDDLLASFRRTEGLSRTWKIRYVETDEDHVHFFISATSSDRVSDIVGTLKQTATYDTWQMHHDYLRKFFYREHFLFTRGYFCSTVGEVSEETLREYIRNQG